MASVKSVAIGFTRADNGPTVRPGVNGTPNPNFARYQLNRAAIAFGALSEQLNESVRRMNLPAHNEKALTAKALRDGLRHLLDGGELACERLREAIGELSENHNSQKHSTAPSNSRPASETNINARNVRSRYCEP